MFLSQSGADVNVVNDVGDTPLHRAAFTGRQVGHCTYVSK